MFVFCSGMWTLQATPCSPDSMLHSESLEHGGDTKPHLEAEWCHLQPLPFCLQVWLCFLSPRNVGSSKSFLNENFGDRITYHYFQDMSLLTIDYGVSSWGEAVTVCMYQVGRLGLQHGRCLLSVANFLRAQQVFGPEYLILNPISSLAEI